MKAVHGAQNQGGKVGNTTSPGSKALRIGPVQDAYEAEADAIADRIVRGQGPLGAASGAPLPPADQSVQRKCAACEHEEAPHIQRRAHKASPSTTSPPPPAFANQLQSARSAGRALPTALRSEMEAGTGANLQNVRIHTGPQAHRLSSDINATAFTHGPDIYFAQNAFQPTTEAGRHLVAHEIAHTLQQRAIAPRIQRKITIWKHAEQPAHLNKANPSAHEKKVIDPALVGKTRAEVIKVLLKKLCAAGNWDVNSSGQVTGGDKSLCSDTGLQKSGTPTGCNCLCEFVTHGKHDLKIVITEHSIESDGSINTGKKMADHGEGVARTENASDPNAKLSVGISARAKIGQEGVGDTQPDLDGKEQSIRDPAFLILGHEMCGHSLLNHAGQTNDSHGGSENFDQTAIDAENAIRREHSTLGNDFGHAIPFFQGHDDSSHRGVAVSLRYDMSPAQMEQKFGIPHGYGPVRRLLPDGIARCKGMGKMPTAENARGHRRIWPAHHENFTNYSVKECHHKPYPKGTNIYMAGIFWHRTIKGETKKSIAKIWGVKVSALNKANKNWTKADGVPDNSPLPVGISVLIPYTYFPIGHFGLEDESDPHGLTFPWLAHDDVLKEVFDGKKVLKFGEREDREEEEVQQGINTLQFALMTLGYKLPSGDDGIFGNETYQALRKFQRDAGMTGKDIDGILGKRTLGLLDVALRHGGVTKDVDRAGNDFKIKGKFKETASEKIAREKRGERESIYFELGKSDLDGEEMAKIARLAQELKGDQLVIHGFASEEGDADFNQKLALARAEKVAAILSGKPHLHPAVSVHPVPHVAVGEIHYREMRTAKILKTGEKLPAATVDPNIITPQTNDTFGNRVQDSEKEKFKFVRDFMQKWLHASTAETKKLYDQVRTANGPLSDPKVLEFMAPRFGLTDPKSKPTLADQHKIAAIHDRLDLMRRVVDAPLHWNKTAGQPSWSRDPGNQVIVSDNFMAQDFVPSRRITYLFQELVHATRDISANHEAEYVALIEFLRRVHNVRQPRP
ncbi:MAG: DUF4157 domain-containing protein [Bacteroidota bacterium]